MSWKKKKSGDGVVAGSVCEACNSPDHRVMNLGPTRGPNLSGTYFKKKKERKALVNALSLKNKKTKKKTDDRESDLP